MKLDWSSAMALLGAALKIDFSRVSYTSKTSLQPVLRSTLIALAALGMAQQAIATPALEQAATQASGVTEPIPDRESELSSTVEPSKEFLESASGSASLSPTATIALNEGVQQQASEQPVQQNVIAEAEVPNLNSVLDQLGASDASLLGAVTSVSQFADVQPTDWAYEALRVLVEDYACVVGYPDQTFRGDRPLTRYEFAAGLAACLDSLGNGIDSETLATIQRLQEEFAAELAELQGRVDDLESRTTILEAQQFSTTTVLRGNAWFNLTQAFPDGDILTERNIFAPDSPFAPPTRDENNRPTRVERGDPQVTMSYLTWLTFVTSFTGNDSLVTQLAVGNGDSPANRLVSSGFYNSWGTPFLDQTAGPDKDDVIIRELFYSFPIGDDIQVTVGPRVNYYRYFDGNQYTFFLTGATSFNSNGSTLLGTVDRGGGAVVQWQVFEPLQFTIGYLAENNEFLPGSIFNSSSDPNRGFFNGSNIISAQLAYSPSADFNLRLIYARSTIEPYDGYIGNAVGEPIPYGYVDDGFGGTVNASGANAFVINFDWNITDWLGIFGRYSYGDVDVNPVSDARSGGDIEVQSFQFGLGFPDLGKPGALGVISFLVPHDYLEGRRFLLSGGGDGGTQYELEASYRYPLTDNIALVPAFYTIWNANNFEDNPTVFVGNLRMDFSF